MSNPGSTHETPMIHTLSLKNFRCHPDVEFGPFRKFNLIYGRNGSGKTSLLEAIQIGLTGWSFRAGTDTALRDQIAHNHREDVIINICTLYEQFSSYQNAVMVPPRTEILAKFYGIDAPGTRARHLLNQLFSTHNILYSEQIVQLLASGTSDDLRKMVRELVLGRDVLETWDRIQISNKFIENLCKDLTARNAEIGQELDGLNDAIKKIKLADSSHLELQMQEFVEILPDALKSKQKLTTLDLDIRTQGVLSQLSATVEEAIAHTTSLRDFCQFRGELASWTDFSHQLEEATQELNRIESLLAAAESSLQEVGVILAQIEEEKGDKTRENIQLCEKLDALGKALPAVEHAVDWTPELRADVQTRSIRDRLRESELIFGRLEQAQVMTKELPSSQDMLNLENSLSTLAKEKTNYEGQIRLRAEEISAVTSEIGRIERLVSESSDEKKRMHSLLLNLHDTVVEFCRLRPDEACPTCGKSFGSIEKLQTAIQDRLNSLTSELCLDGDDYSEHAQKLTVLQERRAKLEREQTADQKALDIFGAKAKDLDQTLREVYASAVELENLLSTTEISVSRVERSELVRWIEKLDRQAVPNELVKIQNAITKYNAEIETLWIGLRRDEFEQEKVSVHEQIDSARGSLAQYFEIPTSYEPSEWRRLYEIVGQARQQLESQQRLLEQETQSLMSRQTQIETRIRAVTKELEGLRAQKLSAQDNIKQLAGAAEDVRTLKKLGILVDAGKPDLDQLWDHVTEMRRQLTGLAATIRQHLESVNEQKLLADQIRAKTTQKEELERELASGNEIRIAFDQLESPESFEMEVWKEYSDTISRLFKKLHWPPDFEAVRLVPKASDTELEVLERKPPQQWIAASKRLSSGQRAALAISVFWALNGRPNNVPKLILMDEPIQNVDDLNILNFLDALRWLVEIGSRQIFLTTANRRVAGLIRRKFSYLKSGFLEVNLARETEISQVEFYDSEGIRQGQPQQLSIG